MFGSMLRSARDYLLQHASLWRRNGAGRAAVALNLAALAVLWALVPMESAPMRRIRGEKEKLPESLLKSPVFSIPFAF